MTATEAMPRVGLPSGGEHHRCCLPASQPTPPMPALQVAFEDDGGEVRRKLLALEKKYADVPKKQVPHPDIGCWWVLYDYGLDRVKAWDPAYKHPYPGELGRGCGGCCWRVHACMRVCVCVWLAGGW